MPQGRRHPSLTIGVLAAALYTVVVTSLAHLFTTVAWLQSVSMLYLLGISAVATVWGLGLGLIMAVASTIAVDLFPAASARTPQLFTGVSLANLVIFLVAAVLAVLMSDAVRNSAAAEVPAGGGGRDEGYGVVQAQAELRRLATQAARGGPLTEIFGGIAREMGRLLDARYSVVARYESDDTAVIEGIWNFEDVMPVGSRWPLDKGTVMDLVYRTAAPGRVEGFTGSGGLIGMLRERGITSAIGCPIMIDERPWGAAIAASNAPKPFPENSEERLRDFAELAEAAITNVHNHAELAASRARVVAAADHTRRQIERDLHDGTQQRLIAIALQVQAIEDAMPPGLDQVKDQLRRTAQALDEAIADLQEISRGLHPGTLAKRGLPYALKALARRSPVAVELNVSVDRRLSDGLEVTIYYVVSEALLNATKHAHASLIRVGLDLTDSTIRLSIDDGVGGADPAAGSGLIGLIDRVEARGGRLKIVSPMGGGTSLLAELPVESDARPVR